MTRRLGLLIVALLVFAAPTAVVLAQSEVRGSIRGTVRQDANADGKCANEPILAGIPVEFVSDDGRTTLRLQSGENGTYGLVAAGLGTWKVSARPDSRYVVTSAPTINAFLGENQRLVLGVDFCLSKTGTLPTVLPVAGASAQPWLFATAFGGLMLVLAGAALELRRFRLR